MGKFKIHSLKQELIIILEQENKKWLRKKTLQKTMRVLKAIIKDLSNNSKDNIRKIRTMIVIQNEKQINKKEEKVAKRNSN